MPRRRLFVLIVGVRHGRFIDLWWIYGSVGVVLEKVIVGGVNENE